jgi:hypothetical protein
VAAIASSERHRCVESYDHLNLDSFISEVYATTHKPMRGNRAAGPRGAIKSRMGTAGVAATETLTGAVFWRKRHRGPAVIPGRLSSIQRLLPLMYDISGTESYG